MSTKPNPKHTRNEAGQYYVQCSCGEWHWAAVPHAIYLHDDCRKKARAERRYGPKVKAEAKFNHCLGHGCNNLVKKPRHFCERCREKQAKYPVRCLGPGEAV